MARPRQRYLNCIGVGDSYVRKQMERILGSGDFNENIITRKHVFSQWVDDK